MNNISARITQRMQELNNHKQVANGTVNGVACILNYYDAFLVGLETRIPDQAQRIDAAVKLAAALYCGAD